MSMEVAIEVNTYTRDVFSAYRGKNRKALVCIYDITCFES